MSSDEGRPKLPGAAGRGLLGRMLGFAAGVVLLAAVLIAGWLLFALMIVGGLLVWAYLWWQTRGLRRQMREQMQQMQANRGEHMGERMGEHLRREDGQGGRVIEGEAIREEDEA